MSLSPLRYNVEVQADRVVHARNIFLWIRCRPIVLSFFILVLLFGSRRANAATYYLSPSGNDSNMEHRQVIPG
jgi:hypothetical protein